MRRKILITFLVLAAIAATGGLLGKQWLVGYLTPDLLVRQIESRWNCRAQIDEVRVQLLGSASVELTGLSLAPRDEFANLATPLAERPRLGDGLAELSSASILLEIRPSELIRRQLNIRQLIIGGLEIRTRVNGDGDATIEKLFDAPIVAVPPGEDIGISLAASELPAVEPNPGDPINSSEGGESISDRLPMATVADRIEVRDAQASFLIEASGTTIRLESFRLGLTEIDVDPSALAAHNRAIFDFGGDLVVIPPADRGDGEYLRGTVSGRGEVAPFQADTGRVDPVWVSDLTLHQGAQVNTFPLIVRLQELLEEVDTAGVDLSDLNIRGTLLADAPTRVAHDKGRYLFQQPLELALPDTTLSIQEGGWMDTGTNQHEMRGHVIASEGLTQKIEGKVDAYLEKKAKGFASESLRNLVLGPVTQDGKLTIQFTSRGDLAKPKADIVTPFGNLSEVIDTGKDTLKTLEKAGKELLKNLFGR